MHIQIPFIRRLKGACAAATWEASRHVGACACDAELNRDPPGASHQPGQTHFVVDLPHALLKDRANRRTGRGHAAAVGDIGDIRREQESVSGTTDISLA